MKDRRDMTRDNAEVEWAERKALALAFIKSYIEENGMPPSRREVQEALGAASSSSAQLLLNGLVEDGVITYRPGIPRSIRLMTQRGVEL